jgi:hypothetical protein
MTTQATINTKTKTNMARTNWMKLGLIAAAVSIIAVLLVQSIAIALWPEIALFAPLDSYIRSAIFTLVPVVGATALFAWLVAHKPRPVRTFIIISAVVLVISFIPDYILPVPDKTILASTVAAFLHIVAAVPTMLILVIGYQRQVGQM